MSLDSEAAAKAGLTPIAKGSWKANECTVRVMQGLSDRNASSEPFCHAKGYDLRAFARTFAHGKRCPKEDSLVTPAFLAKNGGQQWPASHKAELHLQWSLRALHEQWPLQTPCAGAFETRCKPRATCCFHCMCALNSDSSLIQSPQLAFKPLRLTTHFAKRHIMRIPIGGLCVGLLIGLLDSLALFENQLWRVASGWQLRTVMVACCYGLKQRNRLGLWSVARLSPCEALGCGEGPQPES